MRGKDIKRYQASWAGLWLIDTHNGYGEVPPIDVDSYKAVKCHLDKFYPQLEKRQDKGVTPYNLRNCAYHAEFTRDKIVYSEIVQDPQFFLDSKVQYYPEATSFFITGQHLRLLAGVFNSTAFTFFFKNYYSGGGLGKSGYRYKKLFLEKTPVPPITKKNHGLVQKIESLVEATLTDQLQSKNTHAKEAEIDKLVYQLYSLNAEEVALIKKSLNQK